MIKVFTTNKNGKIELTKDELKALLDEAYWDGYRANSGMWTYTSPTVWKPYIWTGTTTNGTVTLSNNTDNTVSNSTYTANTKIDTNLGSVGANT